MENVVDLNNYRRATPIVAAEEAAEGVNQKQARQPNIQYRRTRSTIAVEANQMSAMFDEQRTDAFVNLIKVCGYFGRDEIVVECLEDFRNTGDIQTYADCCSALQSNVVQACRKMGLGPLRIALEKRNCHFDLRIYPTEIV